MHEKGRDLKTLFNQARRFGIPLGISAFLGLSTVACAEETKYPTSNTVPQGQVVDCANLEGDAETPLQCTSEYVAAIQVIMGYHQIQDPMDIGPTTIPDPNTVQDLNSEGESVPINSYVLIWNNGGNVPLVLYSDTPRDSHMVVALHRPEEDGSFTLLATAEFNLKNIVIVNGKAYVLVDWFKHYVPAEGEEVRLADRIEIQIKGSEQDGTTSGLNTAVIDASDYENLDTSGEFGNLSGFTSEPTRSYVYIQD